MGYNTSIGCLSNYFYRAIWNVKSERVLKFVVDYDSTEIVDFILNKTSDNAPLKLPELGEFSLKLVDNSTGDEIYLKKATFQLGGNYHILIQYDEDGTFNVSIVHSYSKIMI